MEKGTYEIKRMKCDFFFGSTTLQTNTAALLVSLAGLILAPSACDTDQL